jgi:hypothetical protein
MTNQSTGDPFSSTHCKAHEAGNNPAKQKSKNVEKNIILYEKSFPLPVISRLLCVCVEQYNEIFSLKSFRFILSRLFLLKRYQNLTFLGKWKGDIGMFVRLLSVLRVSGVVGVTSSWTLRVKKMLPLLSHTCIVRENRKQVHVTSL